MAIPFGQEQKHSGSFRADDVELDLGGASGEKALVQSVQFTINRAINFLYEIGSTNVYYVGNRRQGQCQMSRVVGGSSSFGTLVSQYGDMCNPKDLTIRAKGGCGGASGGVTYTLKKATLNSMGASVTAQEIVINEQLGFVFADLDYTA